MGFMPIRKRPPQSGEPQAHGDPSLPVSNDDAKAKGAATQPPAPAAAAAPPRRGFGVNGLQRPGSGLKQASPHRIAALKKMRGFGR